MATLKFLFFIFLFIMRKKSIHLKIFSRNFRMLQEIPKILAQLNSRSCYISLFITNCKLIKAIFRILGI